MHSVHDAYVESETMHQHMLASELAVGSRYALDVLSCTHHSTQLT